MDANNYQWGYQSIYEEDAISVATAQLAAWKERLEMYGVCSTCGSTHSTERSPQSGAPSSPWSCRPNPPPVTPDCPIRFGQKDGNPLFPQDLVNFIDDDHFQVVQATAIGSLSSIRTNDDSHAAQQQRPTLMTYSHGEATIVRSDPNRRPPNPFRPNSASSKQRPARSIQPSKPTHAPPHEATIQRLSHEHFINELHKRRQQIYGKRASPSSAVVRQFKAATKSISDSRSVANLSNMRSSSSSSAASPSIPIVHASISVTATEQQSVLTDHSLIERGRLEEGKALLKMIRGIDNVEAEYQELVEASRVAQQVKHPFRNLLQRRNRPQLIIAVAMPIFQQFTGINAIMFYAPVLFRTLGFKNDASLYSAVITGAVNVLSTVVSIVAVDRLGRRFLLLEAGVQMFFSQVVVAVLLGLKVKDHSDSLSHGYAILWVVLICTFVSSFAWSWGPLGWLIPSETFPLETRSAGQSVTVCVNLFFTFLFAQAFLSMLCHFKFGIFLFFSGWVLIMSIFVIFFLPETKGVPIEEMTDKVWKRHRLWKRYMVDDDDDHHYQDDGIKKNGHINNGYDNSL
ncbi:hypothetical protein ACLOJK_028885 [Asimina triloba]